MRRRIFGREQKARRALLTGLAEAVMKRGKIRTTEARAKALRPLLERFITKARHSDVTSRRRLARFLTRATVKKLVTEAGPRYAGRPGGYTRITRLPSRRRDGARMAIIEFV